MHLCELHGTLFAVHVAERGRGLLACGLGHTITAHNGEVPRSVSFTGVVTLACDGQVLAWGWGTHGQLGNCTPVSEPTPQVVLPLQGIAITQANAVPCTDPSQVSDVEP